MSSPLAAAPPAAAAASALARAQALETLEAAYAAWLELRLAQGASRLHARAEAQRLEEQGAFLVGAVRAAAPAGAAGGEGALARLQQLASGAEGRLSEAREQLAAEQAAADAAFAAAEARLRALVQERAERYLARAPLRLRLLPRLVAGGRSVLHLERVGDDEAVLLLRLLGGALPTRYGFLRDDSTEDALQEPAPLYPEEGVAEGERRPDAVGLAARLRAGGDFLPVRGFVPLWVPLAAGEETLFRLRQRGPVLEVEVADGVGFRALLTREEAERCTGRLLRLQLEGRLQLEIAVG